MASQGIRKVVIILVHAFIGWVLCGAVMMIGREIMSMQTTLIVHAIAAPVFFAVISWNYFRKFNFTSSFITALIFLGFIMAMDFFLVALVFEKSLDMFRNPLGTWIPFVLIFLATYITGLILV